MEFSYPNLLRNSRKRFQYLSNGIKSIGSVAMRDGVVGDYQRVTLDVNSKDWAYLYIFGIDDVGDVPEGTEIVISCFARVNDGPCSLTPTIRRGDGTHALHQGDTTTRKNVGGGVDTLRNEGTEERHRIRRLPAVSHWTRTLQGWHHHRRRAASGVHRHHAACMGTGSGGGVAVGE